MTKPVKEIRCFRCKNWGAAPKFCLRDLDFTYWMEDDTCIGFQTKEEKVM